MINAEATMIHSAIVNRKETKAIRQYRVNWFAIATIHVNRIYSRGRKLNIRVFTLAKWGFGMIGLSITQ
jgi:hypothetical protein